MSVWRPIDIESANAAARCTLQAGHAVPPGVSKTQIDDRLKAIAALLESGALPKGQCFKADEPVQVRYGRRLAGSLYMFAGRRRRSAAGRVCERAPT